ncbi:hypothetical protein [Mesorhizobium sp. CAU 1741]|uniref:hypothetical protein n=1 Tax=Mesorhizobium sp. CAU 1741 TaxID=3140366 RepID=UPI00325C2FE1
MTPQRFAELVAAYGGAPGRWPQAERAAALDFLEANPGQGRAAIASQDKLDAMLSAHRVASPNATLTRRIAASAFPSSRSRFRPLLRGAAFAGIGAAGALAGALAVAALLPFDAPSYVGDPYELTVFGDVSEDLP